MPRLPRQELVEETEPGVYHCINRCVRRAFLCGQDPVSGKNFEHRKRLIRRRLEFLAGQFALDVLSYTVMSNHIHVIVRNRPDVVADWPDDEVARRWLALFPLRCNSDGSPAEPYDTELSMITSDTEKLTERRRRLSNVSWFMRCLCEPIARAANKEDECTGRFWEGRFKCQRLLDESAILACSVYVDLNPVRAGIAPSKLGARRRARRASRCPATSKDPPRTTCPARVPRSLLPAGTPTPATGPGSAGGTAVSGSGTPASPISPAHLSSRARAARRTPAVR